METIEEKNIFLIGHGFLIQDSARKFIVPAKVHVTFYCKKDTMFDSKWEQSIAKIIGEGKVVGQCPTPHDNREWEITRVKPFTKIEDHLLTRPGNMQTTAKEAACLNIKTQGSAFECTEIEGDLEDNLFAAIKENNDLNAVCVRLSSIISALRKKDKSSVLHLHWLACRNILKDSARDNTASAIEQAKERISWDTDPRQARQARMANIVRNTAAFPGRQAFLLNNLKPREPEV